MPPWEVWWLLAGLPGMAGCLQKQTVLFFVIFWYFILGHPYIGGAIFIFNISCLETCYKGQIFLNVLLYCYSRYMGLSVYELMQSLNTGVWHKERNYSYCLLYFTSLFYILEYFTETSSYFVLE